MAMAHYRSINLKQIQNDTLSHLVLSRASTFSLAATGDLTFIAECLESSQIYSSNSQEVSGPFVAANYFSMISQTSEYIVRALASEKYSQISEFITFEDRLENSLQRDLVKIEHVRMRLAHEQTTSDLFDLELIELKYIYDRGRYLLNVVNLSGLITTSSIRQPRFRGYSQLPTPISAKL
jgi:N-terminal acetyltransferase B complex non-catalytic subunit